MNDKKLVQIFAWTSSSVVALMSVIIWGQNINGDLGSLSTLTIFPVLGLIAFSVMWSHYMVSVARQYLGVDKSVLKRYTQTTSYVVLLAILLHPGLLIYGLFIQGDGLPPDSYLNHYVAPGAAWAVMLGTLSLLISLAYEFHRKFGQTAWWKYVGYATDAAMIALLFHALKLGNNLQMGTTLRYVWYFYAVTLVGALAYIYAKKYRATQKI